MRKLFFLLLFASALGGVFLPACRHELLLPFDPNPPVDTGDYSGVPCSPDTVYFQNQILPLLISQCAKSGCHNEASHEEGVVLVDYTRVISTGKVKAFNPADSKLYKVIIDPDPGDRMPPAPNAPLSTEQKNLIKKWIEQGALNNVCNENYGGCNTDNVTYANFIGKFLTDHCTGCHGGTNPSGGLRLTTYAEAKASGQSGKLYGSIARLSGYVPMPDGGPALSACFVSKVKAWVDAGMPQ